MRYTIKYIGEPKRSGNYKIYLKKYWYCEDGDITKGIFFDVYAPQCNDSKEIIERYQSL